MKVEEIITQRIVTLLEAGTVPWHKPWANRTGTDAFPRNAVSRRQYRGINVFILASQSYGSPCWLTYKEALALGGHVKAGERGTPIVFWKWLNREIEKDDGSIDERHFPMLRYYTVFNAEQTEGCRLSADDKDGPTPEPMFNPIEACEAVFANMPDRPQLEHGATLAITRGHRFEAYYSSGNDAVVIPRRQAFDSPEFYYSVLFHELTHSTGAAHRLNRSTLNQALKFDDTNYSKEELTAEMGAAFLAGHTGIEQLTLPNSAAYLNSWIRALKGDAKLVIVAAAAAQKAIDYILNRQAETATQTESACALAA